ncbi:MAG: YjbQ family protein [Clostridiaceae bacterium]|nr:YjbQ family protein [Clostridiaceae bacterium]
MEKISVKTPSRTCMIDITGKIQESINKQGLISGVCTVFVPHTTAGITINENADPDVVSDILKEVNKVIPFQDGYDHMEGNSAAHIKASLFGFSQQIIVEDGRLMLGTWQGVYFCEFDGPRNRQVYVKVF